MVLVGNVNNGNDIVPKLKVLSGSGKCYGFECATTGKQLFKPLDPKYYIDRHHTTNKNNL